MVQVETSQLSGECNTWREGLRQYRDELSKDKKKLQDAASQPLSKDQLQDVEHLHNQFHIQLINIHDLKQAIKSHDRKMSFEKLAFNGSVNEDSLMRHENLLQEFTELNQTLQELRNEFQLFLKSTG